jgi:hypothetical protein
VRSAGSPAGVPQGDLDAGQSRVEQRFREGFGDVCIIENHDRHDSCRLDCGEHHIGGLDHPLRRGRPGFHSSYSSSR